MINRSKKIKIGLIFGGKSVEHAVSLRSALNVAKYMDRDKFDLILIGISKAGQWFLLQEVKQEITSGKPLQIELAPNCLFKTEDSPVEIDIAFPLLHGTNGEDGSVQGLLQVMDLPVVGSGVLGSAVNMSKLTTKKILTQSGIPVARFQEFHESERNEINFKELRDYLGLPFMVKAANLGSSVGISKVKSIDDFDKAIEEAFRFDSEVLIEEYIKAREIECAIIGNEDCRASRPGEIVVSKEYEFYDFKAKYVDGQAVRIDVPADISEETSSRIQQLCLKAYRELKCQDYARVDLFLTEDDRVFINEINTIPGFTDASMFPMMWRDAGLSFTQLTTDLIERAIQRYETENEIRTDYISDLDS